MFILPRDPHNNMPQPPALPLPGLPHAWHIAGASTPLSKSGIFSPMRRLGELHILRPDYTDVGNQTIEPCSDLDEDSPQFIRKRKHSPADMTVTPSYDLSLNKLFSDHTPCPPHPRKKLRFKQTKLLDLSGSKRMPLDVLTSLALEPQTPTHEQMPTHDMHLPHEDMHLPQAALPLPPITQSTPANLRPPLPVYTFVGNVQTPLLAQRLEYNNVAGYQIMGSLPNGSAGLALDSSDTHPGDRRINDPYMALPPLSLRQDYLDSNKLPLLEHFERDLSSAEMLALVNNNLLVRAFYTHVTAGHDDYVPFLRKERLRWHPDKWVGRAHIDKEVIHSLAQVLNGLFEEANDRQ